MMDDSALLAIARNALETAMAEYPDDRTVLTRWGLAADAAGLAATASTSWKAFRQLKVAAAASLSRGELPPKPILDFITMWFTGEFEPPTKPGGTEDNPARDVMLWVAVNEVARITGLSPHRNDPAANFSAMDFVANAGKELGLSLTYHGVRGVWEKLEARRRHRSGAPQIKKKTRHLRRRKGR